MCEYYSMTRDDWEVTPVWSGRGSAGVGWLDHMVMVEFHSRQIFQRCVVDMIKYLYYCNEVCMLL